ncbi:hypothetical protein LI90_634 [Carbonactinospora thermoautotrophica]|uniref:Uncharacterized protein n=1 Tax=Carbonactinospora thermoautotrophica TaxID=1469144 RepID=A0A132MMI6_9ACTN|nr:hypothetical protein [Carbonactinospora thermoautotrophica]KWW99003.1 hypothetical protein LI90_634 [Carbonactinospora thermoautotrophica]
MTADSLRLTPELSTADRLREGELGDAAIRIRNTAAEPVTCEVWDLEALLLHPMSRDVAGRHLGFRYLPRFEISLGPGESAEFHVDLAVLDARTLDDSLAQQPLGPGTYLAVGRCRIKETVSGEEVELTTDETVVQVVR